MPSINSNTGALFSVDAARKTDEMSTAMKRLSTGDRITNAGMMRQAQQYLTECYLK